MLATLYIYISF